MLTPTDLLIVAGAVLYAGSLCCLVYWLRDAATLAPDDERGFSSEERAELHFLKNRTP